VRVEEREARDDLLGEGGRNGKGKEGGGEGGEQGEEGAGGASLEVVKLDYFYLGGDG